jgi:hypothetical protein
MSIASFYSFLFNVEELQDYLGSRPVILVNKAGIFFSFFYFFSLMPASSFLFSTSVWLEERGRMSAYVGLRLRRIRMMAVFLLIKQY